MGRAYTIEERKAFLNKMYELGKPPKEAAKELGVCATSLYCWGKQHDAHRYYEFLKKVNPYYNHKHKAPTTESKAPPPKPKPVLMETVRHQNVADRYWKIIQHPKGLGCYAVEMVKKNAHGRKIEQINHYFGGERHNFATAELTKTFINNRIKTLTGANIQPIKKMQHFGKGYMI
ncbi:hypothetical protein ACLRAA_02765 [Gallibacterium anatis]|uniref:Transposase n=1 Tax=Gallibacterium anatis TaxID=750 RepID=A0AAX3XGI1_9PAST|nr:hypothetical protein [Gallibacterium anatis]KGQ26300.1 hypothetical protein JP33_04620 [Gallibacterium anatis CCM5995]KGQ68649.1 hypothetical protein IO47_03795 [Gallibacterium anatis]MDK9429966.1 hypothetical protein [Gallibacterium anatis]MDK9560991.1 hypothetical protein [Gallibacterium anatis]WIM80058.1 hypothetical protein QP018_02145 [Gallibacterium anatis]